MWKGDDANPQPPIRCLILITPHARNRLSVFHRHTVFLVKTYVAQVGNDTHTRYGNVLFDHLNARSQERWVATKLINDVAANPPPLFLFKQPERSKQCCEDSTSINVTNQQAGRIRRICHTHIDDIMRLQINLRRGAGSFKYYDLILTSKAMVALKHKGKEFFDLALIIVGGACLRPHAPLHYELPTGI